MTQEQEYRIQTIFQIPIPIPLQTQIVIPFHYNPGCLTPTLIPNPKLVQITHNLLITITLILTNFTKTNQPIITNLNKNHIKRR